MKEQATLPNAQSQIILYTAADGKVTADLFGYTREATVTKIETVQKERSREVTRDSDFDRTFAKYLSGREE